MKAFALSGRKLLCLSAQTLPWADSLQVFQTASFTGQQ